MRIRGIAGSAVLAVLVTSMTAPVAHGEPVVVGQHTIFDTRVAGMPTSTEPWRTLRSVSAETTWETGEVEVTAMLAAAPPEGESVSVTWQLGHRTDAGCTAAVTLTGSKVDLQNVIAATSTETTLARDYTCLTGTLTTGGAVTDQMQDGFVDRLVESGAEADAAVEPLPVLAGKATKALLLVRSHGVSSEIIRVSGGGDVKLRDVTSGDFAPDEVRPVVATIIAPRTGRFTLDLQARDERGNADYDGSSKVRAVPAVGRPQPGTYEGAGITLKVDRRFRVTLTAFSSACSVDARRATVRAARKLRIPRSGATARVKPGGDGWGGVQLVTRSKRRIQAVLVSVGTGCDVQVSSTLRRVS